MASEVYLGGIVRSMAEQKIKSDAHGKAVHHNGALCGARWVGDGSTTVRSPLDQNLPLHPLGFNLHRPVRILSKRSKTES